MAKETFVGVSGFSYPSWKGTFYSDNAKAELLLEEYCGKLGSVEINSSFYAQPGAATIKGWAARTPESFTFAFKVPRMITHIKKLGKDSSDLAVGFSKALDALGQRRGPMLFQLPPYSKQDLGLLESFLDQTSGIPERVFEFRHESWLVDSTFRLLDGKDVAFCVVDTEDFKTENKITGSFAYYRLRRESYEGKGVDEWAASIQKATKGLDKAYVYLRHDETGKNAVLAKGMASKLR